MRHPLDFEIFLLFIYVLLDDVSDFVLIEKNCVSNDENEKAKMENQIRD